MEQNKLGGSVPILQMMSSQQSPQKDNVLLSSRLDSLSIQLPVVNSKSKISSQNIHLMLHKLSKISQSVDTTSINKNPLNLIEYQRQGQMSRHDPQMVQAKLRKLQNRAQLQRAQNQMHLMTQQKSHSLMSKHHKYHSQRKTSINQSYMKIYQSYLKQKQLSTEKKLNLLSQQQYQGIYSKQQQDNSSGLELLMSQNSATKHGIKYYDVLQKHPKLLNLTISKKNQQQGFTLLEQRIKRKALLTEKIKNNNNININNNSNSNINDHPFQQQFTQQKALYKQKQSKRYYQNPQQIIQRQLTKFYMKKNPGKLTNEAQKNQRSRRLIKQQKHINNMIDQNKISKQDRKKLQSKYNDLVNELAKSDRRKSLEGLLPQLKQLKKHTSITKPLLKQQNDVKRKLFNQNNRKQSLRGVL